MCNRTLFANPDDARWTRRAWWFTFGIYNPRTLVAFASGMCDALEIAAEYATHIGENGAWAEDPVKECDGLECDHEGCDVDLTYTESGWLVGWEWSGGEYHMSAEDWTRIGAVYALSDGMLP